MTDPAQSNRELWNEWTRVNSRSAFYDLEGFKRGGIRIKDFELEEIGDVTGKDLLHLQCHFGIDTLSWARLGANVTGVDFSEDAIALARSLATELELEAEFVHASVLELPGSLDGRFDLVYTSRGALYWLSDLGAWAEGISRALRPGGMFYVHEISPVALIFDDSEGATEPKPHYPYFHRDEPLEIPVKGSYADPGAEVATPTEYSWVWTLGDIVSAVAGAGLRVEFLRERPELDWQMLPFLARRGDEWIYPGPGEIPLSFTLRASKR